MPKLVLWKIGLLDPHPRSQWKKNWEEVDSGCGLHGIIQTGQPDRSVRSWPRGLAARHESTTRLHSSFACFCCWGANPWIYLNSPLLFFLHLNRITTKNIYTLGIFIQKFTFFTFNYGRPFLCVKQFNNLERTILGFTGVHYAHTCGDNLPTRVNPTCPTEPGTTVLCELAGNLCPVFSTPCVAKVASETSPLRHFSLICTRRRWYSGQITACNPVKFILILSPRRADRLICCSIWKIVQAGLAAFDNGELIRMFVQL